MYSNQPQPQTAQGYILSSDESMQYQQPVQYQHLLTPTQTGQYMYVQNAPAPSPGHSMMPPPAAHQAMANITPPASVMSPPIQQAKQLQALTSTETLMKVMPKKSEKGDLPLASPLDDSISSEFLYLRIPKLDLDKPEIKKLLEPAGQSASEIKTT